MNRSIHSHLLFWPIFTAGLLLDLWSKAAVFRWFENNSRDNFTIIEDFLSFRLALNSGAAFGIAEGQRWLLIAVSIAALGVVLTVFFFDTAQRKIITITLALLAAGICGNLYDRLFNNGLVRDFIDVVYWPGKHWPAFNVADSLLCIAVGLLFLSSIFSRRLGQKRAQQQK
ncbi:MAG: signal peptidase II [Sedimentisphaerales bacterium]|nr:signal peptidase II [Sedimentisphaerales bacterium]